MLRSTSFYSYNAQLVLCNNDTDFRDLYTPFLITGFPIAIHNKKKKDTCTDQFGSTQKDHTITKMNDNINMGSTIAGSMNARS